jgi:hypothetical protein
MTTVRSRAPLYGRRADTHGVRTSYAVLEQAAGQQVHYQPGQAG